MYWRLNMQIEQAIQDLFSTWQITVKIGKKQYIYELNDYHYNRMMEQYRAGQENNALVILNKWNERK